ncbi:MAG TPA: 30S ribosomal protein S9 [Terriglobales bacterium]|nr:30S ribosomal protein S9 [Terriglobales bacterium]
MAELVQYRGTGRRKLAVARVILRPGSGQTRINGRELEQYFPSETLRIQAREPLRLLELTAQFDLIARVEGGGPSGQSGALRMGIARALLAYNAELRARLRAAGMLTRDSRMKERKKYGQKGARKRFQFSKR